MMNTNVTTYSMHIITLCIIYKQTVFTHKLFYEIFSGEPTLAG